MEMEIKNIIKKIKEEGVAKAEHEAGEIIKRAEEKAGHIIKEAEKEKIKIVDKALKESQKLEENAKQAIVQASRDMLLSLREKVIVFFDQIMKQEVMEQISPEFIGSALVRLIENFNEKGIKEIEILLNEKDKKDIERFLFAKLKEKMAEGITLKVSPSIEKGFRIGRKDKASYYDFTDDALAEAFKNFMNPKMCGLLGV